MKLHALFAISAVALLSACGGGSSGVSSNPTINRPILNLPSAINRLEVPEGADRSELIALLSAAEVGDYVELPYGVIENLSPPPFDGMVKYVVGETILDRKVTIYAFTPKTVSYLGDREVSFHSSIEDYLESYTANSPAFGNLIEEENAGETLFQLFYGTHNGEFGIMSAKALDEVDLADAMIFTFEDDGVMKRGIELYATGEVFLMPIGQYDYTGLAAVQWDNGTKLAQGDVQMSVTFSNTTSTANIDANSLTGDGSAARFSGNLVIDSSTGSYSSTSASLTTDSITVPAGIVGIFASDAGLTAGSVFDAGTVGEQVSGVFSMSRD